MGRWRLLTGLIAVVGTVGVLALLGSSAHAQSVGNAAEGLQISPASIELNAEPGKSYTLKLTVTNVTVSDLAYTTSINDFTAKDESGAPSIDLDTSKPTATSIQPWVGTIPSFTLKAHQSKEIDAIISVPLGAEPGGHYGVIRFSGQAPSLEGTGVGLSASAGTLVLVRVAGAVDENLNLITFESSQGGNPSSFFEYGPIDFITRFENKGNVHVKPIGQIEIHDSFGNKVDTLDVNSDKGNVLPLSIRKFQSTLNRQWLFGHYTADISIAYGTTGQALVQTISFWVIPYKLIIGGLIILATLIFVFRTLIKRYNTYIIKRAGQNKHHDSQSKKKKQKK